MYAVDAGVAMAERLKSLVFGSGLQTAQVQILSVTVALFISTINLVLYRFPLFCLIRSSHRPVAHKDGKNKGIDKTGVRHTMCWVADFVLATCQIYNLQLNL
ncbi:hypothetical protein J6590_069279 [Homalodisca vitripennis]|nr:hypothetical protein J6590_095662 [Homalodisca vitripennis]KAG8320418.1 hypothetical protein J6590_069279 [Homalodisca vitripennis]